MTGGEPGAPRSSGLSLAYGFLESTAYTSTKGAICYIVHKRLNYSLASPLQVDSVTVAGDSNVRIFEFEKIFKIELFAMGLLK